MLRSLYSGVSGMKTHQVKMDVIGNNIANVNTTGFKSGSVNFTEMLSQTLRGAIAPGQGGSGINPIQVGLGTKLGSIGTMFTQGGLQPTEKVTDLAIQGNGFLVLSNQALGVENFFTRDGSLSIDKDNNLVHTATGSIVQGNMAVPNALGVPTAAKPTGTNLTTLSGITIDLAKYSSFSIDKEGKITGILKNPPAVGSAEEEIAFLAVVSFDNLEGLSKSGDSLYQTSLTSGPPNLNTGDATVESGYLEMSNVDLTQEFTNMITTQRGFQANSRIITTSDSMLEELLSLKR